VLVLLAKLAKAHLYFARNYLKLLNSVFFLIMRAQRELTYKRLELVSKLICQSVVFN